MADSLALRVRVLQHRDQSPHLEGCSQLSGSGLEPDRVLDPVTLDSLLHETGDFLSTLQRLAARPRVRGAIVHDARVAAICVAHGVDELLSADRDFALFPELRTRNPLLR